MQNLNYSRSQLEQRNPRRYAGIAHADQGIIWSATVEITALRRGLGDLERCFTMTAGIAGLFFFGLYPQAFVAIAHNGEGAERWPSLE
jgi:hypothetical protein